MTVKFSTTLRNNRAEEFDILDGGTIEIYDGSRPANVGTAVSGQVLLGVLTFGSPAFGAPSNGVVTANAITGDAAANAGGTATWARFKASGGAAHIDVDVSAAGGGGELILVSTTIVQNLPIEATSCVITEGGA